MRLDSVCESAKLPGVEALLNLNAALAGRYNVEREIGSGGMATVYLARDVRHDRRVALKVLRPELGAVLGVERFLSEIKVTANLQHPNLLPLFDSGEANGLLFYVMPFVEGESLRARLARERQLPVDEAVRIAVAICSALHYAHQHGVIHRDLKPENILLQADQPVVADFGIALAVSNAGGTRITQTGLSLGTPQYMSPEQATGDHAIDGRTDTYSLAAVLYEMLTGEPPHTGPTVQAIIARVLTDKPRPVRAMRETVPAYIEATIHKALAKVPADRFVTPNDFAQALVGRVMLAADASEPLTWNAARPSRAASWLKAPQPWAVAFAIAAIAALWSWLTRPDERAAPPARFELTLPPDARLEVMSSPLPIAVSPDGRQVVYAGTSAGGRQLYVRKIDELDVRPLSSTSAAISPAISPDGRWIAWAGFGSLHKKPLDGGPTVDIANIQGFQGLAWASDDELIVSAGGPGGAIAKLWRVSASGGPLREFTRLDSAASEAVQSYPVVLREHGLVLYSSSRLGMLAGRLAVARLSDAQTKVFDVSADFILGFALGHVIYMHDNGVMSAIPFDARKLSVTGAPVPLIQQGLRNQIGSLSPSGTLVYARGSATNEVVIVDELGVSRSLIGQKGQYAHPRLSPDGRRLAIDVTSGLTADIWTYDVATGTPTRLTTLGNNDRPEWTPDGKSILYLSARGGDNYRLWWQAADGSAPAQRLHDGSESIREAIFTPDARAVIFREDHADSLRDIRIFLLDSKDSARALVATRFDELMPRLSPDGKWLAYQSNESGQYEIYVRPFPSGGGRTTISTGGGTEPLWAPDRKRIFYRRGPELVAVTYSNTPTFTVSSSRTLFSGNYELHPFHQNYDILPDGKRFIMVKPGDEAPQLVVVVNWIEELRQRLGVRR